MKRSLTSLIGAALLAAFASAPTGYADTVEKGLTLDGSKKAAAGLRQLAGRALPSNFDQGMAPEYTKQSTWLKSAASRCDAVTRKLQAAKSKDDIAKLSAEWPNLRGSLQKENGEFSFGSQAAKARQEEAARLLQ